jgi:hypothetical protein
MDWNPDPNFDFNNMEITAEDLNVLNADFGDLDQGNMLIYDTNYYESPQRNPSQHFNPLSAPYQQSNTPYYPMTQVQESHGRASAQTTAQTQVETYHGLNDVPFTKRSIASLQKDLDLAIASGMPINEIRKYRSRVHSARIAQNRPLQERDYYKRRSIEDLEKARADAKAAGADKREMAKYYNRIRAAKEAQGISDTPSAQNPQTLDQEIAERKRKERQDRDQSVLKAAAADVNLSVGYFCKLPLKERQAARERVCAKGVVPPLRRPPGNNAASQGAVTAGPSSPQDHRSGRYGKDVATPSIETATARNTTHTMPPTLLETAGRNLASPQINWNVSPRGKNVASPQQTSIRSPAPGGNHGSQSRTFRADSHDSPLNFSFEKSPSPNHSAGSPQAISSSRNSARESIPRGQSSGTGISWKGISSSPGSGAGTSWKGISSSPGSSGRQGSPRFGFSPHSSDRRVTPRLSPGPSPLGIPTQSIEPKDKGGKETQRIDTGAAQTRHGPGPSRWEPASLRAASAAPGNIRPAPAYGIHRNDKATKTLLGRLGVGRVASPEAKSRQFKPTTTRTRTRFQIGTDRRTKKPLKDKAEVEMAAREKEQAKFREAHHKKQEKVKRKMIERDLKLLKDARNKKERDEKEKKKCDRTEKAEAHKKKRIGIKKAQSSQTKQNTSKPSRSAVPKRKW